MVPLAGRRKFLGIVTAITLVIASWLVWRQQRLATLAAAEEEAAAAAEEALRIADPATDGEAIAAGQALELALVFFDAKDGAELGSDPAAVEPLNRVCAATWDAIIAQLAPIAQLKRGDTGTVTVEMVLPRPIAEAMRKDFYARVSQELGGALAASLQTNDAVRARLEGRLWLFGRYPTTVLLSGDGVALERAQEVRWVSVIDARPDRPRTLETHGRVPRAQLTGVFGALATRVMATATTVPAATP